MNSIQIARITIGFSWIYHGIFPKLIHVAPLELAMTSTVGFSVEASYLITKAAGILEVIFGLLFLVFYRMKSIVYLNIAGLTMLLLFVMLQMPSLLVEAFNPVTTNLPLIALSFTLLNRADECGTHNKGG
ncbi:DoxX-like family protein [Microbulbifer sp. ZKSA006]|uniref:DoxX-like family protein n=1 Tax=Microbulbifer sp. ZKSA006 TaxID=3243390 RepID=UPI00403A6ED2